MSKGDAIALGFVCFFGGAITMFVGLLIFCWWTEAPPRPDLQEPKNPLGE